MAASKGTKATVRDVAKPAASPSKVKKTTEVRDVANIAEVRVAGQVQMTDALQALASRLGIDMAGATPDQHIDRAALNLSRSAQYMLAAGVDLIAARAQVEPGHFLALIAERGFSKDAAYRAISYAQFLASRPIAQQEQLLALPRFKVLELAKAEPEVLDVLMDEGGPVDLKATNVRELAAQVRELNKALTDMSVQRDTAVNERNAALNRLADVHRNSREDQVPTLVADLRAEAEVTQLRMARWIDGLHPLGGELIALVGGEAHAWVEPTAVMVLNGMIAAHVQLGEQIKRWSEGFNLATATVDPAYDLTDQERLEIAQKWDFVKRCDSYEKELREWDREQARPRDKGRPRARPEAPKGYTK